jgi:hypothetical protein
MEQWEIDALEAQKRKEFKKRWPLAGLKVRRRGLSKWEYGIIVVDKMYDEPNQEEYFIKYEDGTREQLICLPYEIEQDGKWIEG